MYMMTTVTSSVTECNPPVALLTCRQVAEALGTSPGQVRNLVARAQFLAPVKIAGLGLRWGKRAVEQWISEALAGA